MDVLCIKCGEPWDFDELHELVEEQRFADFDHAAAMFRARGCYVFTGKNCTPVSSTKTAMAEAMYEVCGDDMDGAASLFEDYADILD